MGVCGSAPRPNPTPLSLPSLGVSSLDLGRLWQRRRPFFFLCTPHRFPGPLGHKQSAGTRDRTLSAYFEFRFFDFCFNQQRKCWTDIRFGARTETKFNGVGRLRTYISFTGVLVKAPPWIVTAPSSKVLCSAYMIGLPIYGIKRPRVGNLSSRPTILSLGPNCLRWRRSARRSPVTSKII